jgi:hypothetical protein
VSFHPINHTVLPFLDGFDINCTKCFWEIGFECVKCIITVVVEVFFDCTPEEFNKIQLAVEFREENAKVSSSFDVTGIATEREQTSYCEPSEWGGTMV